jgi:hypothetical protein
MISSNFYKNSNFSEIFYNRIWNRGKENGDEKRTAESKRRGRSAFVFEEGNNNSSTTLCE